MVVGGGWVVCGQTLRQVVAQLELELLRPCQYSMIVDLVLLNLPNWKSRNPLVPAVGLSVVFDVMTSF